MSHVRNETLEPCRGRFSPSLATKNKQTHLHATSKLADTIHDLVPAPAAARIKIYVHILLLLTHAQAVLALHPSLVMNGPCFAVAFLLSRCGHDQPHSRSVCRRKQKSPWQKSSSSSSYFDIGTCVAGHSASVAIRYFSTSELRRYAQGRKRSVGATERCVE